VRQAQDVAPAETGEPTGPDDEQEAQGAHAPDQVRIGAFAGARLGRGQGIELEFGQPRPSPLGATTVVGTKPNL
jgi:hypothetical protein